MDEKIVFSVEFDEDEVQSFAEANFGRELTEMELHRLKWRWYEADCERDELLLGAIGVVVDTEKYSFDYEDKLYLKTLGDKK